LIIGLIKLYCYQGIINHVDQSSIHCTFSRKFEQNYLSNQLYLIRFGYNPYSIRMAQRALHLAETHHIIDVIFPSESSHEMVCNC
jgi:hypothetical protein